MTNLVSQLPDPNAFYSLGWLLVALASLAVGAKNIFSLLDRWKEKPSPPDTYVAKTECKVLHFAAEQRINRLDCEVSAIRNELQEMEHRIDDKDEQRTIALHNRLNSLEALLNRMDGKLEER